jgi:hypothetical protein
VPESYKDKITSLSASGREIGFPDGSLQASISQNTPIQETMARASVLCDSASQEQGVLLAFF